VTPGTHGIYQFWQLEAELPADARVEDVGGTLLALAGAPLSHDIEGRVLGGIAETLPRVATRRIARDERPRRRGFRRRCRTPPGLARLSVRERREDNWGHGPRAPRRLPAGAGRHGR